MNTRYPIFVATTSELKISDLSSIGSWGSWSGKKGHLGSTSTIRPGHSSTKSFIYKYIHIYVTWMLPPFGADLFDISFSYGRLISTWPSANSLRAYRVNTKKIDTLPCSKFDFNLLVKPRTFIGAREKKNVT